MKKLYCVLALAAFALTATAAPVAFEVDSHPVNLIGGGQFAGTLNGVDVLVYCVDAENVIKGSDYGDPLETYQTRLGPGTWTAADKNEVRAGNQMTWQDGNNSLDSQFRYKMAAYLIESYAGFPSILDNSANDGIQLAIWKALDIPGGSNFNFGHKGLVPAANAHYASALSFVNANPNASLFNSWSVLTNYRIDAKHGRIQTFMVHSPSISTATPEPATFGLIGAVLVAAGVVARKRNAA